MPYCVPSAYRPRTVPVRTGHDASRLTFAAFVETGQVLVSEPGAASISLPLGVAARNGAFAGQTPEALRGVVRANHELSAHTFL